MQEITATVSGRVQGVMFRNYTQNKAKKLGVTGFVKNCLDGTVFVRAQGDELALSKLIERLEEGPWLARVEDVSVTWQEPEEKYTNFQITY